jgi:hypothetical protein
VYVCPRAWVFKGTGRGGTKKGLSLFRDFEGVQLSLFVGGHPHFVLCRAVVVCAWLA